MTVKVVLTLAALLLVFVSVGNAKEASAVYKDLLNDLEENLLDLKKIASTIKDPSDPANRPPDETDIDVETGFPEEIDDDNIIVDDDKVKQNTMTENEINENLGYNEDEMIITEDQRKRAVGLNIKLWKDTNGQIHIPYIIDSGISSEAQTKLRRHIGELNTAIRCNENAWKPRTSADQHYVKFQSGGGCSSYVGRVLRFRDEDSKTYQPITLAEGCVLFNDGTALHEMLHAMGFTHEQSRSDRDAYVTINFQNIQDGRSNNFRKLSSMVSASLETPYDYGSVMHYNRISFSVNGRDTITPKIPNANIGQRNGMSPTDIEELNKVYSCITQGPTTKATPSPPTRTETIPATITTTRPPTRTETRPATRTTTRPATIMTTRPATRTTTRSTTRMTTRPATRMSTRPVTRMTNRPATRTTTRPATRTTTRPATRMTTRSATRTKNTQATTPTKKRQRKRKRRRPRRERRQRSERK